MNEDNYWNTDKCYQCIHYEVCYMVAECTNYLMEKECEYYNKECEYGRSDK